MKAREKLIVSVSILASCIAIAAFAMVSLGRFISTPSKTNLPVVGRMYQNTVEQIALLNTVTVPSVTTPTGTKPPSSTNQPAPVTAKDNLSGSKKSKHKSNDAQSGHNELDNEDISYDELRTFFVSWYRHTSLDKS